MFNLRLVTVAAILLTFVALARAQDNAPELLVAEGMVDKADKETVIVIPRQAGGRLGRYLSLRLTGTSKISLLGSRTQGGKVVIVQREIEAKDLQPKQEIAVIYTSSGAGLTLLSAVVHPAPAKK